VYRRPRVRRRPDHYFRNNGKAKFKDRTSKHFPEVLDPTTDAAFGDIDGDLDLVVGTSERTAGSGSSSSAHMVTSTPSFISARQGATKPVE
jgi:hypothetical protein